MCLFLFFTLLDFHLYKLSLCLIVIIITLTYSKIFFIISFVMHLDTQQKNTVEGLNFSLGEPPKSA